MCFTLPFICRILSLGLTSYNLSINFQPYFQGKFHTLLRYYNFYEPSFKQKVGKCPNFKFHILNYYQVNSRSFIWNLKLKNNCNNCTVVSTCNKVQRLEGPFSFFRNKWKSDKKSKNLKRTWPKFKKYPTYYKTQLENVL